MSVIINSTTINFSNSTDYLLEINIEADQDDSFHVKSNNDIIVQNVSDEPTTIYATFLNMIYGSKLRKVILNLQSKKQSRIVVNSKSCLEIAYEAKIPHSQEHISGYLPLSCDFQGRELSCNFSIKKGIWYDSKNNVAIIGQTQPCKQELIVEAFVKEKSGEQVFVDEYNPALCTLVRNDV